MDFRCLGLLYNFERFLILKFSSLVLGIGRERFVQFAIDLREMRPQF